VGSPVAFLFELIEEVEVVDDYVLHIETSSPFAALPSHLAHTAGSIISPAVIEEDYEQDELLTAVNLNPVGTGPFQFEEISEGDYVTLVKIHSIGAKKLSQTLSPLMRCLKTRRELPSFRQDM